MRWNDSITFLAPAAAYQDSAGAWHEGERVPREVMCNARNLNLDSATTLLDMGLRHAAQVQVRAVDYNDEDQAIYHGKEYEVIYVTGGGETRYLTLARRIGNDVAAGGEDDG